MEDPSDLSQNQDEASDLHLVFGALAGLRAVDTNQAIERSNKRYDETNHRWHEARLAERFGVPMASESEGEGSKGGDEMGNQVWVRSPVHFHYGDAKKPDAQKPEATPEKPSSSWPTAAILAAALIPTAGIAGYLLAPKDQTTIVSPGGVDTDSQYAVEKWTPD